MYLRPQTLLVHLISVYKVRSFSVIWTRSFRPWENLGRMRIIHSLPLNFRLQREEEEAFASSQSSQGAQSLTFSKFEEKKTNEKTRKVTTVKKFFSASSRAGSKKGNFLFSSSSLSELQTRSRVQVGSACHFCKPKRVPVRINMEVKSDGQAIREIIFSDLKTLGFCFCFFFKRSFLFYRRTKKNWTV